MLFHGTNQKGVEGILKQGFKNSKKGWFGQGVYMTDCSDKAQDYCTDDDGCGDCYIFVNEVLNSEKLQKKQQTLKFTYECSGYDQDTKPDNPFENHVFRHDEQLVEEDYKNDSIGRKYRNVCHNWMSALDEYVADETLIVPSYLITIKYDI